MAFTFAAYEQFIDTHFPNVTRDTKFQLMTRRFIKEYFPQKYHKSIEWEYQAERFVPKVNYLDVWAKAGRRDKPMRVLLTENDSTTMYRIMSNL